METRTLVHDGSTARRPGVLPQHAAFGQEGLELVGGNPAGGKEVYLWGQGQHNQVNGASLTYTGDPGPPYHVVL